MSYNHTKMLDMIRWFAAKEVGSMYLMRLLKLLYYSYDPLTRARVLEFTDVAKRKWGTGGVRCANLEAPTFESSRNALTDPIV